ncbi:DUF4291 family protein [Kribbella sp. GL6]|uniref:DUF4291 family protein n=1 Tax=Kribbella sp. GL6 TaxID=3419765 RepID=UPI003CFE3C1C
MSSRIRSASSRLSGRQRGGGRGRRGLVATRTASRVSGYGEWCARQVRALCGEGAVAVYQTYSPEIAEPALRVGDVCEPFGMGRMTWIKPSFLWMAYRSGWGTKPGQTRVLRVWIRRSGFEWALGRGVLSHYQAGFHESEASWKQSLAGADPVGSGADGDVDAAAAGAVDLDRVVGGCGTAVCA